MTPEVIAILGVGAALLAVLVPLLLAMRGDIHRLETRLDGRIDAVSQRLGEQGERLAGLETMGREQGERLTRIETRLDAIADRLQLPSPTHGQPEGP